MNLPRPPFNDNDLDREIRNALHLKTRRQEPSEYIWLKIKAGLEVVPTPQLAPRRMPVFSFRLSTVAQVALVMVILVISGININSNFNQLMPAPQSTEIIQSPESEASVLAMVTLPVNDRNDDFLNKRTELQTQTVNQASPAEAPSAPVIVPPTDMMPHGDSPQGRLVTANTSSTIDAIVFPTALLAKGPVR